MSFKPHFLSKAGAKANLSLPSCFSYRDMPTWQTDIIFQYPDIYLKPDPLIERHYIEGNKTFCNLRYGFEFEKGWMQLAAEFSFVADQMVKALHRSGIQPSAYIRALVFKEKHGRLLWQGSSQLTEPFKTLLKSRMSQLTSRSQNICEMTGKPGRLYEVNGIWKVLCASEEKKLRRKTRALFLR